MLLAGVFLTAAALWRVRSHPSAASAQQSRAPLVMGTTSRLVVVGPPDQLQPALDAALAELRQVEAAMSTYDAASELSRFNRAAAGEPMPLSEDTLRVLAEAERFSRRTGGAFDVTVGPLLQLWERAAERDRLPTDEELRDVRAQVGYENVTLDDHSATKRVAGLSVSLDAIAKGYAIHRAVEAMRQFPLSGGMVDVGGDIECFGRPLDADAWRIALQHPRGGGRLLTLNLGGGKETRAVCTSGDYRRFFTVEGRRFSHIIDPRDGRPAERAASVTVIGPDAFRADAWATALSVLGPDEGLALLERQAGWEAYFVTGQAETAARETPGFRRYVVGR